MVVLGVEVRFPAAVTVLRGVCPKEVEEKREMERAAFPAFPETAVPPPLAQRSTLLLLFVLLALTRLGSSTPGDGEITLLLLLL